MKYPSELFYTAEHLWVRIDPNGSWLSGITDYAQDLLGDIVYLEPPKIGDALTSGQPCGIVESVKTGSDLHAPMNGTVTEINEALLTSPEQINDNPYEAWIFKFTPISENDSSHLLSAEAYAKQVAD
jgi:glycine cleavage system H protein